LFAAGVVSIVGLGAVANGELLALFIEMRDDLHGAQGGSINEQTNKPKNWLEGVDRGKFFLVYIALIVIVVIGAVGSLYFLWINGDQLLGLLRF
jgi:hypothetical protein